MADFTALKQSIAAAIRANGEGAITGPVLQDQLLDMVDAMEVDTWGGLITEDTVPPTDTDKPHVLLAVTEGYYEAFDLTVEDGDIWLVARMADEVEEAVDPETGETIWIDTADRTIRNEFASRYASHVTKVEEVLKKYGIDQTVLYTGEDYVKELKKLFERRGA